MVKQKFCASSWLFTEKNILRCSTVSKTSKYICVRPVHTLYISHSTYINFVVKCDLLTNM